MKICYIEGTSKQPGYVEEDFYCYGGYAKSPKKHLIMTITAIAEFAVPVLEKSKEKLNFRLDVGTDRLLNFLQG